MITRVELKNWRSHLESKFDFSPGTNILLGSIGSGKSSVLDAICFAFFGTFPNLQTKKIKLDDVIMRKPTEKNRAEVEVHFQSNGKNYSVKRVIEKGKGTTYSEIRDEGKLIEAPNTQRVTEIVEEILKVDYELFSKAIYSEQNALDYFLTIAKGQRMKKIDELLAIDKFEKARAAAVTLTNRIIDRKLGIESTISQINGEELKRNAFDLEEVIRKLVMEKESLKKDLDKITEEKTKLEEELQELKKIKENLENLKREERGKESVLEETLKTIKSIEDATRGFSKEGIQKTLEELEKFEEKLEQEKKQKKEAYERLFSEISQNNSKKFLYEEKVSRLKPKLDEKIEIKKEIDHLLSITGENIDEQLEKTKTEIEKINFEISSFTTMINDLNSFIQHLSSPDNKCPVCDSILTQERKNLLIKQKQEQLNKLEDKLGDLIMSRQNTSEILKKIEDSAKKISEMYLQIKDMPEIQREIEDSEKNLIQLNSFLSQNEKILDNLRNDLEQIEKQIKENESKKRKYEILLIQLEDLEEKKKRSEVLKRETEEIKSRMKEIEAKLEGKDLARMEEALKSIISKESEVKTRLQSYDSFIQEKELRKREYEEKLKDLEKQNREVKKLEHLIRDLEIFSLALQQTQIELRSNFVEAVNYTMNKLWSTLYPYHDFVSVRLNAEEGDYVLQLQGRDGNWMNVEGIASGGERSIACLALRIAFALVLAPTMRIIFLDEPSHNLDQVSLKVFATTLKEKISEFIDQVFLITHQSELEDALTGNGYLLERDKEKDGVTKVVAL
ncbi:MAG: SMC family ATPase [Candidatus Aenigmatarchaeota archaeon]